MQRLVVGVPVPADPAGLLETLDVMANLTELLQGRKPGGARPDDAVAR
jgi:hypothetical protein